jgi:peptide/nickel transport system permease protein
VPFVSLPAHGDGSVRCIRVEELARVNATWGTEDVGAELVVGADPLEPVDQPATTAGVSS